MSQRIRRILALALLIVIPTLLPGAARATTTITVTDDHGSTLTLAAPPQRLISLAPNVTEIFYALGLGSKIVAVSSYSNYPAAASKLPVVINYTTMNIEKTIALKPDLIVAAAIVPQTLINKLRSLHLAVLMTDPHDIRGILNDITLVGHASGVDAAATTLTTHLQARIARVDAAMRRATTHPSVFYELDPTLYTVGHGSFVDALITEAGGRNVTGNNSNPYPQISHETLIKDNPDDYILGDSYGSVTPASVAKRPGFAVLSAVQRHHIYPFNDDLASRPGPRIVDGLEALAHLIHPELFK